MSDKNNPFPFWNTDWLEAQRKYMEALTALGTGKSTTEQGQAASGNGEDLNPWNKALEYWWQAVSQTAPGEETREFYNKLIDQTQGFYFLTEQLSRFMQGLAEVGENAENWQEQLDKCFDDMKSYLSGSQGEVAKTLSGMFGAWQLPMDTLHRTMSSGSMLPGDFLQAFKPDVQGVTDKFLSVPGVGYTRESQEQAQEWMRLLTRYQRTAHEYQLELSKVGIKALDHMKQRIMEMAEKDEEINSLREIYDLWVDCNEQAYADYVMTPEYSELYGRLVNDLMALKRQGQGFMDETVSAMGMPTRRGMNTLQKRQHEMRRELIAARNRIEALENELEKVNELEREVKAMKASQSSSSQSRPVATSTSASAASGSAATTKKTTKKKTTKKKTASKKASSNKSK